MWWFLLAAGASEPAWTMHKNFYMLRDARSAVISGELADAKKSATELSHTAIPAGFEAYKTFTDSLLSKTKELSTASSVKEASVLITEVAVTCGSCHKAAKGGPQPMVRGDDFPPELAKQASIDLLWLGILGDDNVAWKWGTSTLKGAGAPPAIIESFSKAKSLEDKGKAMSTLLVDPWLKK